MPFWYISKVVSAEEGSKRSEKSRALLTGGRICVFGAFMVNATGDFKAASENGEGHQILHFNRNKMLNGSRGTKMLG